MKVVLVEVGKPAKITDIPHDLKAMQTIVEGPIQALYTIEGNSNNMVRQNNYPVGYGEIKGYGVVT